MDIHQDTQLMPHGRAYALRAPSGDADRGELRDQAPFASAAIAAAAHKLLRGDQREGLGRPTTKPLTAHYPVNG